MGEENFCASIVKTHEKYKGYSLMISFIAFAAAIGFELYFGAETFVIVITIVMEVGIVLILMVMDPKISCSWGDESKN